ncbi:MAG: hypothetical protein H6Q44_1881, partial [Deltaproteobacteria bacterium]|nr:hypothetical protein [Deltaproteobacteria bacterium]
RGGIIPGVVDLIFLRRRPVFRCLWLASSLGFFKNTTFFLPKYTDQTIFLFKKII